MSTPGKIERWSDAAGGRQSRLQPIRSALTPWLRATNLGTCQLYWMPVPSFPVAGDHRQWLLRFHAAFTERIAAKREVKPEIFLQMKLIYPDLRDSFIKNALRFSPFLGLGRQPGKPLPPVPDEKYAEDLQKGNIKYDHKAIQPDFCYWFIYKRTAEQCQEFLGYGGMITAYIKPDDKNKPLTIPDVDKRKIKDERLLAVLEKKDDLQRVMDGAFALQSPFLKKSKELFAADLAEDPQYSSLPFVLPLLNSASFFEASVQQVEKWFSVFDFYLSESKADRGILLATKHDIEQELADLMEEFKAAGFVYQA